MKKDNWWNRFFFKDILEEQEEKYRKLKKMLAEYSSIIDVVINAAAKVQHFGDWTSFKESNIDSLCNIINFCKKQHTLRYCDDRFFDRRT